jgi:hypothetical protein
MVFLITTGIVFVFFMFVHSTPMWKLLMFGWDMFWMGTWITLGVSALFGLAVEAVLWLI